MSGTGIGLALARSLAELHGGWLEMNRSLEENTFELKLPLYHAETIAIEPMVTDDFLQKSKVSTSETQYCYSLLVVEDNKDMQTFIVKQLSSEYHVFTSDNGIEALDILKEQAVNLVISDIMMPEMDGLELCQLLKSNLDTSHIPIVLLTAKTTLQAKIEGMKLGADVYIEKPFSVEYLKVCIANLLNNREKLRASFVNSPFVQTNSMALTKADEAF